MIILVAEGQSARISDLDRNFNFKAQSKSAGPWTEIEGSLTLISSDTQEKMKKRRRGSREEKNTRIGRNKIDLFSRILQARLLLSSPSMNSFVFLIFIMCN